MKKEIVKRNNNAEMSKPMCVVGIGASAGGLEALQQLLTCLPIDTGMAYVIIQHLSPDHPSLLQEILSKYTKLPIIPAQQSLALQKNRIYLITPGYDITVTSDGVLNISQYDRSMLNHPVDIFFRSLAEAYKNNAVAVVLSGTGSDGTNGIRSIKEHNGLILAQNPENAKFDGMPRNAISTGFVDLILTADAIGSEMSHIATLLPDTGVTENQTDEELLNQIFTMLRKFSNINFTYYKKTTILRRIERRMVVLHMKNIREYVSYLAEHPEEVSALGKELLIGVTSFFRDPEYFETLKDKAIRTILTNSDPDIQVRVWVAGCSTGEEAYSIAILFLEAMEEYKIRRKVKIFATDLDLDSINFASKGIYGENIIEDVALPRLSRFFTKRGNKYVVNQEVRRMIIFAQHNVFQDPPFGKLDLISCRNMMIYFQTVLQHDLFGVFHMALNDGAFLFLGKSEAVSGFENVFQNYCMNERIFVHHAAGRMPSTQKNISALLQMPMLDFAQSSSDVYENPYEDDENYEASQLYLKDLEAIMPATLLVSGSNELCHSFGDCSRYLAIPNGSATLDIFSLLREEFRIAASTALKAVRDNGKRVCYENIPVKIGEKTSNFTLTAIPMSGQQKQPTDQVALSFFENAVPLAEEAVPFNIDEIAAQRISDLEKELHDTRVHLRGTTGELESVNAELQAANEELLTANEELQSSNEELQSVNEELYTVNAEYQDKVTQLASVNDDVSNFLSSTLVGIMFVDEKLNLRNFTTFIAEDFKLVEQDIGRSLRYIAYNFQNIDLVKQCEDVMTSGDAIDIDATTISDKNYLIRIAPFTEESGISQSLVLTFVDTTRHYIDQQHINEIQKELRAEVARGEEKSNFLSRISHDMRTPMNTINGLLELSLDEKKLPDAVRDNLEKMHSSSKYLISIIDDVLDTSKIRNSQISPNYEIVKEESIIRPLLPMFRTAAENNGLEFRYHTSGIKNTFIIADTSRVCRIISNLISNAVKFTDEGGCISLDVHAEYSSKGVAYTYFVSDTGCGISDEFQQKMFEPFEQDGNEKSSEMNGTGLGLYICKSFVDLLGGSLVCESTPGNGSTFIVKLSYDFATEEQIKNCEESKIDYHFDKLKGMRVLLCEDHSVNAAICAKLLGKQYVTCDIADNGKKGLEMFTESEIGGYDAILMDIRMPILDGIEATKKIRALDRADAKDIPIIALSADSFEEQKDVGYKAGITEYLAKPFDSDELYRTLFRAVSK